MTATWAEALTDQQLSDVLYEMRRRGWAVTAYESSDALELFDGVKSASENWFDQDALEDAMCEAAHEEIRRQLGALS